MFVQRFVNISGRQPGRQQEQQQQQQQQQRWRHQFLIPFFSNLKISAPTAAPNSIRKMQQQQPQPHPLLATG
ncbi:uncharacterized protein DMAD_07430 [Drosophila madeirensis]|uniref:Uncharacterized protein n=1 Tax=Drosophila madeirensis TaxID=30013 RepID=A0AAU9FVW3_DROMD